MFINNFHYAEKVWKKIKNVPIETTLTVLPTSLYLLSKNDDARSKRRIHANLLDIEFMPISLSSNSESPKLGHILFFNFFMTITIPTSYYY